MTITAKFSGTCTKCRHTILVGEQIEWSKGQGASHTHCYAATPKTVTARTPSAFSAPTRICWECGCRFTQAEARRNDGDWQEKYCGC